jgi:crotonobetainyl-CoA:carnitine CoA-transferase CaiB-like acyl-CoA transferase
VVLDLETADGRDLARRLVQTADVVLEDLPVGYLATRGLGYEALAAERPALVYTSVTGFGQTGPHAHWAYGDIVGQAMGGIMTLAGDPEDPPNRIYGQQADISTSLHAAQGTLAAVIHAEATGEGQRIDVSAQEAVSMSQETAMQTWDLQRRNRVRTGRRGTLPIDLPGVGIYRTRDGWVSLYVLAPAGADLPDLVGWMREAGMADGLDAEPHAAIVPELNMRYLTRVLAEPGGLATIAPTLALVNQQIAAFLGTLTAREAYEEGQRRRLLVGIVSTPRDLAENTQLRAREWFTHLTFEALAAEVEFPGPPYRLSATPAIVRRPPMLGEHTERVLAALPRAVAAS